MSDSDKANDDIARVVSEAVESLVATPQSIRVRSNKLYSLIDHEFPAGTETRYDVPSHLVFAFRRPLQLLLLGQNASCFIELHATLEVYARIVMVHLLTYDERKSLAALSSLVDRKGLGEIAETLVLIGVWQEGDLPFIRHLCQLRNGVAHRNYSVLRKALAQHGGSKFEDALKRVDKVDVVEPFVRCLKLLGRLMNASVSWKTG